MRIGEIIGTVTLNRSHPSIAGARLKLVVPYSLQNLVDPQSERAEEFVIYDDLGAGVGSQVAISEGGEAAQPFLPELKPIDAYNAALLDNINIPESTSSPSN